MLSRWIQLNLLAFADGHVPDEEYWGARQLASEVAAMAN